MKRAIQKAPAALAAAIIVIGGLTAGTPFVFAERVLPGLSLGKVPLGGVSHQDLPGILTTYEQQLKKQPLTISLREQQVTRSLAELGVSLDITATTKQATGHSWREVLGSRRSIEPVFSIDNQQLNSIIEEDFALVITPPVSATLDLAASNTLTLIPAQPGEAVDQITFTRDLVSRLEHQRWSEPVQLTVISAAAAVQDNEVDAARSYAEQLLRDGLELAFGEETWIIKPFTVRRLLTFVEQVDPFNADNKILGVSFDGDELTSYLTTTIAPEINQEAQDARFERSGDRVVQFAVPDQGRTLNLEQTIQHIAAATARSASEATLAVDITEPAVKDVADIHNLGITTLLASGVSDFAGSPSNRVHNIKVGTSKYHGLLIAPGDDFSFNRHLGSVDASAGYLPELVIKNNVTTPEFGGGLCQVSTTAFRAAIYSGLDITERRNHSYAVRYYGKPGFDATIYPGHTDLRFTNNTPGYILIQTRVVGTKVYFDFWGTDDGREVKVAGPVTYDYQPDGAVKATLSREVIKDSEVLLDDTFYSRYKSPELFPKVVAADDPNRVQGAQDKPSSPEQAPKPSNDSKPTPSPAASSSPTPAPPPAEET